MRDYHIWRGAAAFLMAVTLISGAAAIPKARTVNTADARETDAAILKMSNGGAILEASDNAAILIDNREVSGSAAIAAGTHTISARADGDIICVAVYENQDFKTVGINQASISYDFPESGAEIALFCLDEHFRPLRTAVRVSQREAAVKLLYSGQAYCYPDEDDDFNEYIVRLKVVTTKDGEITEIKDIEGYNLNGKQTNSTNRDYLGRAAAEIPEQIIAKQSTDGVDAVSGATCASEAIMNAVKQALKTAPEEIADEDDKPGEDDETIPDGVYAGSARCLTKNINYIIDLNITVENGVIKNIENHTLDTPMSTKDKELYQKAWDSLSGKITGLNASDFKNNKNNIDAVSGATVSSGGIADAVRDALESQAAVKSVMGERYAPEGISLYARVYPVVTVANGKITGIQIIPVSDDDEKLKLLDEFAGEIVKKQSVTGLEYPDKIQDDAFDIANLIDQILYGKGVLK